MTTKLEKPLGASQTTHVAEMPPLEVVTEGIPPMEHIEFAPAAQVEPPLPVGREGRGRMLAWALAGVLGLLLVVAGVFAFTQYSSTGDPDLTVVPPVGSAVGEPVSESVYSGLLEGSVLPHISNLSIPSIPSIADVSIAPIPAISPIPAMSIPSIPGMSIPDMSIPSTPSTPFPEISFPEISIPEISIPPFTEISIPPFPEISFPDMSIPEISIPPFPDM